MLAGEIRSKFLEFFKNKQHHIVESSSTIPIDDQTLLFTNAGMNQFKAILLGEKASEFKRAVSVQKCVRISGKHNDLDEVGKDGRHHTLFEMLGNWSFGDYYKKEAIEWAWEFLTKECLLPIEKLHVSVFPTDEQSYKLWKDLMQVPTSHIHRLEENFWTMGPIGPCGPCSEIFYDQGDVIKCQNPNCTVGCDCDRYLELWNLVFMESDRQEDGSLKALQFKSVDTGLGLERIVAVLNNVYSNFDTDIFIHLKEKILNLLGKKEIPNDQSISFNVIADHIRMLTFTIADGGSFSNEGRGYVLRRVLRRAVRHGKNLGFEQPFLHFLVGEVINIMGDSYPEITQNKERIEILIKQEEQLFFRTVSRGLERIEEVFAKLRDQGKNRLNGQDAFMLHSTFGFPIDLTEIVALESGFTVDKEEFDKVMSLEKSKSQASAKFYTFEKEQEWNEVSKEGFSDKEIHILRYRRSEGEKVDLLLSGTDFYAQGGGQVADKGELELNGQRFPVMDVLKTHDGFLHVVEMKDLSVLKEKPLIIKLHIDNSAKRSIARNHTATHLLHQALKDVLGVQVAQKGSLVERSYLRFDFTHNASMVPDEIKKVNEIINKQIMEQRPVVIHENLTLEKARAMGAIALFGEKYGQTVRVIEVDGVSKELCGGTHVSNTANMGGFLILAEMAVAAGIRRIEAITGEALLRYTQNQQVLINDLKKQLHTTPEGIVSKVVELLEEIKTLKKQQSTLKSKMLANESSDFKEEAVDLGGLRLISKVVEVETKDQLGELADKTKDKNSDAIVVLGSIIDGKPMVVVTMTKNLAKTKGIRAGDIVKTVAQVFGGKGGGRPDFAQAGGSDPSKLSEAIKQVPEVIKSLMG